MKARSLVHSFTLPFTLSLNRPPLIYTGTVKPSSNLIQPSRKEFLALAKEHTLVPVYRTLTADLETPVSAFLRAAWQERECFLLESVENGEQVGRYTFIGLNPYKRIVARGRRSTSPKASAPLASKATSSTCCAKRSAATSRRASPGLPPFTAGAVGFFAYDAVRQIERLPNHAKDELGVPDACLLFFDEVLAFDHVRKQIWLVVTADVTLAKPDEAYAKAVKRLAKLEKTPGDSRCRSCPHASSAKAGQGEAPHQQEELSRRRRAHQGVHRGGRHFPGGAVAAPRRVNRAWTAFQVYRCAAHREPQPVHVLPALHAGGAAGRSRGRKKRKRVRHQ